MRQDEGKNIVYGVLLSFPLAIVELILAIIISGLYAGATGNYFVMERAKPGIYSVNKKNCKKFLEFSLKEKRKYKELDLNPREIDFNDYYCEVNILNVLSKETKINIFNFDGGENKVDGEIVPYPRFDLSDITLSIDFYYSINGVEEYCNRTAQLKSWGEVFTIQFPNSCITTQESLGSTYYEVNIDYYYFKIVDASGLVEYQGEE